MLRSILVFLALCCTYNSISQVIGEKRKILYIYNDTITKLFNPCDSSTVNSNISCKYGPSSDINFSGSIGHCNPEYLMYLKIMKVYFRGPFAHDWAVFNGLNITQCTFDKSTNLLGADLGSLNVNDTEFKQDLLLANSKFSGSFWSVTFNNSLNLRNSTINSNPSNYHDYFPNRKYSLYFSNVVFNGPLILSEATVNGDILFERCLMPPTLHLDIHELNGIIDLSGLYRRRKQPKCKLRINPKFLDRIIFNYADFELVGLDNKTSKKSSLIGVNGHHSTTTIENYENNISASKMLTNDKLLYGKVSRTDVFEKLNQLESHFKKNGDKLAFEKVVKEKLRYELIKEGAFFTNFIQLHWWDYGFRKELIIKNTLILFIIFLIINFSLRDKVFYSYPLLAEDLNANELVIYKKFKLRWNSIIKIFILTIAVFGGLKFDFQNIKYKFLLTSALLFIEYVIGKVCLAYLFNFLVQL